MPFRLTTIATFRTPIAAWVARNYLSAIGIRAFLIDEHMATAVWTWGNAIGWTKLQVELESEQAAHQALLSWRDARDLLMSECMVEPSAAAHHPNLPPPCMDHTPITAAEMHQPTMNPREDLIRRAKWAAFFSFILAGNPAGLPGEWERTTGAILFLIGMFGLLGYSSRLLWKASQLTVTIRPKYQNDLFWARCVNAIMYSVIALFIVFAFAM